MNLRNYSGFAYLINAVPSRLMTLNKKNAATFKREKNRFGDSIWE